MTMLDLVVCLSAFAKTDHEVVARATELIEKRVVVLRGSFAGQRIGASR